MSGIIAIPPAVPQKLFDASAASVGNSDPFSLPTIATQITWQTSFGSAPASTTIQLQTSMDSLTWATIDTSTSTAGESRTISTSAIFVRARINAISGGSAVTLTLNTKTGFVSGIQTPTSTTIGSLVTYNSTTGQIFGELLFPGGTTTFLRADGTFATPAGGGGGGTPSSPVNSVQYNNAGSFGGDSTITIEGSPLALVVANMGSAFGSLAIPNNDQSFPYNESGTGLSVLQNNGATGYDENTFLVDTILDISTGTTSASILAEWTVNTTSQITGLGVKGWDHGFNQTFWTAINIGGDFSGVNDGYLLGMNISFSSEGISPTGDVYGIQAGLAISGTQRNVWNYWAANPLPFSGTATTAIHYYGASLSGGGTITNAYYSWFDSQGVRRVREDSTFNSVAQAIEALYNPQFTKYTPGATDFERLILGQWESNVAVITTEKGGSGTLRAMRIGDTGVNTSFGGDISTAGDIKGATYHVGAVAGIDASITTGGLVGKTITVSKGIITGFA